MNDGTNAVIGLAGSGATFGLTDVNPYLAFVCGILTLVHLMLSFRKMWKERKK
tara:strand:+ start:3439 stop:3597 length:159 start_codon:yes stop_codon:yes gene_type:complete